MSWQDERRRDRAARAEQVRQDALAAAQVETVRAQAAADAQREDARVRAELEREAQRERRAALVAEEARRAERKTAARDRRKAAWAGVWTWAAGHVVDLLIYPLAVVSAVMAVPAMAAFGHEVYGTVAGYALPVITELGMWAFALAVQYTRTRHPDRPVWALQAGVWCFAALAFGLNALHGLMRSWVAGTVMGAASVAGVGAHQLVTAAPRRGRAERDAARIARRAHRKVTRVRRAAIEAAVAEVDQDGAARLLVAPGRYTLTGRRPGLETATVPGLPVDPIADDWDRALAALLHPDHRPPTPTDPTPGTGVVGGGPVATLDRPDHHADRIDRAGPARAEDQQESTPDPTETSSVDRPATGSTSGRRPTRSTTRSAPQSPGQLPGQSPGRSPSRSPGRSIEALRIELATGIEAGAIDPTSAESIRRGLRCSPARARQLRDQHTSTRNEK